jgi:DUF438 domain-containing protein
MAQTNGESYFMRSKKGEYMHDKALRSVLDQIPVGITVTDLDGKMLYYNEYCARTVDRKPEYIGMDIRSCHKKPESIPKIDICTPDEWDVYGIKTYLTSRGGW